MSNFNTSNLEYQRLLNILNELRINYNVSHEDIDKHLRLSLRLDQKTGFPGLVSFDIYKEDDFKKILEELSYVLEINSLSDGQVFVVPGGSLPQPGHGYLNYLDKDGKPLNIYDLRYRAESSKSSLPLKIDREFYDLQPMIDRIINKITKMEDVRKNYFNIVSSINSVKDKSNSLLGTRKKIDISLYGSISPSKSTNLNIGDFLNNINDDEYINNLINNILNGTSNGQRFLLQTCDFNELSILDTKKIENIIEIIKEKLESLEKQVDEELNVRQEKLDELVSRAKEIIALSPKEAYGVIMSYNPSIQDISEFKYADSRRKYESERVHNFPKSVSEASLPSNTSYFSGFASKSYSYDLIHQDSLIELQERQAKLLSSKEKEGIMVYKSQLFRAMNPIVKYMREHELDFSNIFNDTHIIEFIRKAYDEYIMAYEEAKRTGTFKRTSGSAVADRAFDQFQGSKEYLSFDEYMKMIFTYIPYVESALKKVVTTEEITVYRGVPKDDYRLPNHFLSTSLASGVAKDFIINREQIKNNPDSFLGFYEIVIPAGSPVIVFNEDLFNGNGESKNYLDDSQQEILIDPSLFDFKYDSQSRRTNYISIGSKERILTYEKIIAKPKDLEDVDSMGTMSM